MSFIMASPPLELSDSAPVSGFWVLGSGSVSGSRTPYSVFRISGRGILSVLCGRLEWIYPVRSYLS